MAECVGIIGGTGVGSRLTALPGEPLFVPTEFGVLRGKLIRRDGFDLFVTSRHSAGHSVPPHKVNYRALAVGMRKLGVKSCLATAAVGSLHTDWLPGTLINCSDCLDFTFRNATLFDRRVVHTDFTEPFSPLVRSAIACAAESLGVPIKSQGTYLCANGPRYESPQEIRSYAILGADIVGMTASTEAILMKEAGVLYGCLAIVTNLACGLSDEVPDHSAVENQMTMAGDKAVSLLLEACGNIMRQ